MNNFAQTVPQAADYIRFLPEIVLTVFGLAIMVLDPLMDDRRSQRPLGTIALLGSLAALALMLSAIGIYSVISYSVSQRTREIGIRMALGASDGSVASMVVRQGLLLALIGLGAGLLGALAMGRIFSGLPSKVRLLLLFDVHPTDPLILGLVSVLLTFVALLACFLPARRAAKVDPMVALRYE